MVNRREKVVCLGEKMLRFYNTLTRQIENFAPQRDEVRIYTCGPTVYDYAHIGNLRTYVFEDILIRLLKYKGYKIKRVMNITDVGHLTSNEDIGEDKIIVGAKREKKTPWEIAEYYTKAFKDDIKELNILEPDVWAKATEHIKEMIELIRILEKKGFTYRTSEGIYFDISKLSRYGRLSRLKLEGQIPGIRVKVSREKRNPSDFALWKFASPSHIMQWDSPWGRGFPGWHIECSAISRKYLGDVFDIHCGGVDHIPVHHTNEIAQLEGATGKVPARFWMHGEFLLVEGGRMGKSEGNAWTLRDIKKRGFKPLALRYFYLTAHYRAKLNFTWKALESFQRTLEKLWGEVSTYGEPEAVDSSYKEKFLQEMEEDLNTPRALAVVWKLVRDSQLRDGQKRTLLLDFDKVLGLGLEKIGGEEIPQEIRSLLEERNKAREAKDFFKADTLREEIKKRGWRVEDTPEGVRVKKIYKDIEE